MSKDSKPSLLEIEGNIRIAREWENALHLGTFPGRVSVQIATLLDFLKGQREHNEKQLEAMTKPVEVTA